MAGSDDDEGGDNGSEVGDGDGPTSTTTTGAPISTPTGPIEATERSMAVSSSSDDSNQDVQICYQDLETTDILYRRYQNDDERASELTLGT